MKHCILSPLLTCLIISACIPINVTSAIPNPNVMKTSGAGLPSDNLECSPPCWKNLTPGKSSLNELQAFIQSSVQKGWSKISELHEEQIYYCDLYNIADPQGRVIRFMVKEKVLSDIEFYDLDHYPLSQLLNEFGPPEFIESILSKAETETYGITVHYPKQGLSFKIDADQNRVGEVAPELLVEYAFYYAPGDMTDYYFERFPCNYNKSIHKETVQDTIQKFIRPWTGFGKVEIIRSK
jgi:hypothetical protein